MPSRHRQSEVEDSAAPQVTSHSYCRPIIAGTTTAAKVSGAIAAEDVATGYVVTAVEGASFLFVPQYHDFLSIARYDRA